MANAIKKGNSVKGRDKKSAGYKSEPKSGPKSGSKNRSKQKKTIKTPTRKASAKKSQSKKATKPASKTRSRGTTKAQTSKGQSRLVAKKSTAKHHGKDRFHILTIIAQRLGVVGGIGVGVTLLVIIGVLWAGGYFGLMAQTVLKTAEQQISKTMVAAGFEIKDITLDGRNQTKLTEIEEALGPVKGLSILHFDPHGAKARIEDIGWVHSASVSRLWPDRVKITIEEREPAAIWQINSKYKLIDLEGAVISEVIAFEYSSLPLIVGAGAPEAASDILNVLEEVEMFNKPIAALVRMSDRRWDLRFTNNMDVRLPETGFQEAVRELALLHQRSGVLDHDFEYIDFRDPERAYFRCKGGDDDRPELSVLSRTFSCTS